MKVVILLGLIVGALGAPRVPFSLPRVLLSSLLKDDVPLEGSLGIVGGNVIRRYEFPFLVSLQYASFGGYSHYCGGSIYNSKFIVDAAHCVEGTDADSIRVVASEYSLRRKSGLEQNRSVKKITMHPDYDDNTLENDIAILELDSPLDFSTKRVGSISLGRDAVNAGTNVTVTGWGTLQEGGRRIPSLPRKVTVPVISNEDCSKSYAPLEYEITDTMLCAGFSEGGKDSCQADSGGPLFTRNPFTLVGIVSWGEGCGDPRYPGVYTRVSEYIDFIEGIAGSQ